MKRFKNFFGLDQGSGTQKQFSNFNQPDYKIIKKENIFDQIENPLTPLSKLIVYPNPQKPPVVLIIHGTFSPIHKNHIRAMESAKNYIQSNGYQVLGGYLNLGNQNIVKAKLKEETISITKRLHLCQLAVSESDWLMIDTYQILSLEKKVDHIDSENHLREVLYNYYKQEIKIITVCGVDALPYCRPFYKNGLLCVVNRPADYDYHEMVRKWNEEQEKSYIHIIETEIIDLSSTMIRLWLKNPDNYQNELLNALNPLVYYFLLESNEEKKRYLNGFEYYKEKFELLEVIKLDEKDLNLIDSNYINRGYTAQVIKTTLNGHNVALKQYNYKENDKRKKACFYREIIMLTVLSSNNIIQYYGWVEKLNSIVLDLATSDMAAIIPYIQPDPSSHLICINYLAKCIIHALKALRHWNIYHRDIMMANILWFGDLNNISLMTKDIFCNGNIKLCDFGLSKFKDDPPLLCGWPIRRTPQMVINRFHYCIWCDLYLFGLTLWEAWSGIPLSSLGLSKDKAKCYIYRGWKPPTINFPPELQVLLNTCWDHDANYSLEYIESLLLPQ